MTPLPAEPFGTLLGTAPGGVEAYSSDYVSASKAQYPSRKSFRSYFDGIYMGHKWQCVEFARRWLYINHGYLFDDVAMAFDIFDLRTLRDTRNNTLLPLNAFANGCLRRPEPGCLLIWQEGGEFEDTGHVAIVTEVTDSYVRVAEQNVGHGSWEGRDYARQLAANVSDSGEYWITCSYGDAEVLGWMLQTADDRFAEPLDQPDPQLRQIKSCRADTPKTARKTWLNIANPDEEAFVAMMGGHRLTCDEHELTRYFVVSRSAQEDLESATNELHGMFMHATDYVLEHQELLHSFNLPAAIIPKIQQSWDNRLNDIITSRFDFALTPSGLKVYEYNCDSASCYMESGKVQGKWAHYYGVDDGEDAGAELTRDLVRAWKRSQATGCVHILRDTDLEEKYHAHFMQDAIEAAGLRCKIVDDLSRLSWDAQHRICDQDGDVIEWVWKTWAWETALGQIRDVCSEQDFSRQNFDSSRCHGESVDLSDVLFHKDIMVFEPLWSLIPSNKAILPVLWKLFPNHPLLLNCGFEVTDELVASGYVEKPIVGRCGANITLVYKGDRPNAQTDGQFSDQTTIYQQMFRLPRIAGLYVQVSTFTAAGVYAGAGVRVDKTPIITKDSDCLALRVVSDKRYAQL